jgi:hypothetical protein
LIFISDLQSESPVFRWAGALGQADGGNGSAIADAIDGKAAAFYAAFGFTPLTDRPNTLYLPVATAQRLLSGKTP